MIPAPNPTPMRPAGTVEGAPAHWTLERDRKPRRPPVSLESETADRQGRLPPGGCSVEQLFTDAAGSESSLPCRARAARVPSRSSRRAASETLSIATGRRFATVMPLVTADVAAMFVATICAFALLRLVSPLPIGGIHRVMPALAVMLVAAHLGFGMYSVIGMHPVQELRQLTRLNALVFLATAVATFIAGAQPFWRLFFAIEWIASLLLLPLLRSVVRARCVKAGWWGQPALVFGPVEGSAAVARALQGEPGCGLRPVARVGPAAETAPSDLTAAEPLAHLRTIDAQTASRFARRYGISYGIIVVNDPAARASALAAAALLPLRHLWVTSADKQVSTLWCDARECGGLQAVEVHNQLLSPAAQWVKRASDIAITCIGGLLILPLVLTIALLVKLSSPGPIFYGQTRLGISGGRFKAWKFRTMRTNSAALLEEHLRNDPAAQAEWDRDHKLRKDPRVTRLGAILRKTSLDELPQLWNVLRGDMSLVGPRPIVDEEVAKYGATYMQYTRVRPGITGLWQVSGRNDTTYAERLVFDEYYVRNWSPWLDLHLLARTVAVVLARSGAY